MSGARPSDADLSADPPGGLARFRPLLRYPRAVTPWLVLAAGLSIVASMATALQPLPLKLLVDHALGGEPLPATVERLLLFGAEPRPLTLVLAAAVASFVVTVVVVALNGLLGLLWEYTGRQMVRDLRSDLFDRLQHRSPVSRREGARGDLLARLSTDTWAVYTAVQTLVSAPLQRLLTIGAVGVTAWILSPSLTTLLLAVAVPLGLLTQVIARRLKQQTRRSRHAESRVVSYVNRTIAAMPVVQAFTGEERTNQTLAGLTAEAVRATRVTTVTSVAANSVSGLLLTAAAAAVLIVGGNQVMRGQLSVGTLLVVLTYVRTLDREARALLKAHGTLVTAVVGLDRVLEVWGEDTAIVEPASPVAFPPVDPRGARVELRGVTVGYEPGRPVLHEVDLAVQPGQTVALVGPSGAGKTTLVSLLPRFLDPWQGEVRIDGVDLRQARLRDVRRRVALVRQDPILLPASVADNIAYGRPDATREQIEAAAADAGAAEFIDRLADGYDTVLGEDGATLSGGQRARLAIARAFLKDAPLLILDEPTAALDARTEALLVDAIARLTRDRTVLVIAHRPTTIHRADIVLTLDHGRITSTDTHQPTGATP
jgi:ATP-binding cassette subfamily B protein/subfamily B ATP-binding cassette protein MsbA